MNNSPVVHLKSLRTFCAFVATKLSYFAKSAQQSMKYSCQFICHTNPLFIQVTYFALISFAGYEALKVLNSQDKSNTLKDLDVLFTSVSASTVSSMATVEMEEFSSKQLWILAILMLIGSEVFTSILGLHFVRAKFNSENSFNRRDQISHVDIESINVTNFDPTASHGTKDGASFSEFHLANKQHVDPKTTALLGTAVTVYLLITNLGSSLLIYLYLKLVPDAQEVLKRKGIGLFLFSVFTAISSVANCGFTPVNENMIIFQKNSGLLLLIIPQILVGNTLFAPCLRFMVWSLQKITGKQEWSFILEHPKAIGYRHLMSTRKCAYLILTVVGFIILQTILFCSFEWSSEALQEMSSYQKIVGALFQSTNARHAGESIVDLSSISSAIIVLYTVMMYLPGYTSFLPNYDDRYSKDEKRYNRKGLLEDWILSQLSYLAIFVMLICITEREALTTDPLNFNVLSILFEVVSAYGNVGLSMGYSCKRLLKQDLRCKDASYGFAGRWSNEGKMILIIVMVFGRLKASNLKGGKAWKLR
ncbi:probable cation transporter HKT6 [Hordeum vulgare subsp. vulgare]|uniref:Sodium transporter n=1 Tax=Hordeum vulgare subsp. vulgare TaxID=112509 RepID=A0A8I6Y0M9_HORVV|nr:probable cation transporter HKT6 [Hordeum vulgare subsp. vulgare]